MLKGKILIFILGILLLSCARKGSPGGGPKDTTPPKFVRANPENFSVKVSTDLKEIKIDFDEYLVLKDPQKQIVISPPPAIPPVLIPTTASPRKYVQIKFKEPLKSNTTYNINFGESIQDLNEGNALTLYQYIFSTGDYIDSLSIKGSLRQSLSNAKPENPVIALYRKDSTKIDLNQKPYYFAKVDSSRTFKFEYLHEGDYQLIAFTDKNNNLRYDGREELLAFEDSIVNPINFGNYPLTLSQNKVPFRAKELKVMAEGKLFLLMNGQPEIVGIKPISNNFTQEYKVTHKPFSDTLAIYFNPENLSFQDKKERIGFQVVHQDKIDSLEVMYDRKSENKFSYKILNQQPTPNKKVKLTTEAFISSYDKDYIQIAKDSIPIDFDVILDTLSYNTVTLDFPFEFESSYTIDILPKAFINHVGKENDSMALQAKTKSKDDYGNLKIDLVNAPSKPFFFQLIEKNEVINSIYGSSNEFIFSYLSPGEYQLRILVDENENGHWDIADFEKRKQAEPTFLFKNPIEVRALWDLNEVWALP